MYIQIHKNDVNHYAFQKYNEIMNSMNNISTKFISKEYINREFLQYDESNYSLLRNI